MPRRNKPDANEAALVAAFQAQGCIVRRIGQPLDLLVGYRHRWCLVEIKNPDGRNRLQKTQADFIATCKQAYLPVYVVSDDLAVCNVLDDLVTNWPIPYSYSASAVAQQRPSK